MNYEINEQYLRLAKLIAVLMQEQFYGTLEIKMEAGNIQICRKTETIKI